MTRRAPAAIAKRTFSVLLSAPTTTCVGGGGGRGEEEEEEGPPSPPAAGRRLLAAKVRGDGCVACQGLDGGAGQGGDVVPDGSEGDDHSAVVATRR